MEIATANGEEDLGYPPTFVVIHNRGYYEWSHYVAMAVMAELVLDKETTTPDDVRKAILSLKDNHIMPDRSRIICR